MKKILNMRIRLLVLMLMGLFAASCAAPMPANKACQTDLDCVPAQCCHAADAVNLENAPDCRSTICTMECAPNTLDCGQGSVACVDGACRASFN